MDDVIIIEDSKIVKKSNALARAKWTPESIWEPRLVAIVAAQVHQDDKEFKEYKIPIPVLLEMAGKSSAGAFYADLRKIARQALGRVIEIKDDKGWAFYSLFSKCSYRQGDDFLILRFDPDLKQHYLELQNNYKGYPLVDFLALPSIYSQKLYEILRSWDDRPSAEIKLIELHEMLCVPASMRKNFAEFRRRVLEKSFKDITTKTNLKYEWEPIKQGRKVVKIRFIFSIKKALKVAKVKKQDGDKKQSKINNKLFLEAVKCASEYKNGCGPLKNTKKCCTVCQSIK